MIQIISTRAVASLLHWGLVRRHQHTNNDALTRIWELKTAKTRKNRWKTGGCTSISAALVFLSHIVCPESTFSKHHGGGSQTDGLDALNTMVSSPLLGDVLAAARRCLCHELHCTATKLAQFGAHAEQQQHAHAIGISLVCECAISNMVA